MAATTKMTGLAILALVVLGGLGGVGVWQMSNAQLNQHIDVPAQPDTVPIPTDVAAIQHGAHMANAVALCSVCHGANLTGGVVLDNSTARIAAPNLTRGGIGLTDAQRVRAIREGVDPSGRRLLLMPSDNYYHLSDADVGAIVAYIDALPPVAAQTLSSEVRPLGRLGLLTDQAQLLPAASIDLTLPRPRAPDVGVTPAYGAYLAEVAGCDRCHGPALSGGRVPNSAAVGPNITSRGLPNWSDNDFLNLMRTGKLPDGRLVGGAMPWQYYAQMTEIELRAIWAYVETIR